MATVEKVIEKISQIAERRNNTTVSDIEWVVNQLREHGFQVREPRRTRHGVLYGVGPVRFMVCTHNPGSKQVKGCYVDDFLNAMVELGLYEE
jgi:hypothetical protein